MNKKKRDQLEVIRLRKATRKANQDEQRRLRRAKDEHPPSSFEDDDEYEEDNWDENYWNEKTYCGCGECNGSQGGFFPKNDGELRYWQDGCLIVESERHPFDCKPEEILTASDSTQSKPNSENEMLGRWRESQSAIGSGARKQ